MRTITASIVGLDDDHSFRASRTTQDGHGAPQHRANWGSALSLATVNEVPGTTGPDSFPGTSAADHVAGLEGDDYLRGGGGDDQLDGGADNDRLYGGDGNDTVWGGTGNDQLYGDAGDDKLYGGDGADAFRGSAGADLYDGGDGVDVVNFGATTGVYVFLDGSGRSARSAVGDTFIGIENLLGSVTDGDWLVGDGGANRLVGQGGADKLWGRAGVDQLEGGDGDDELVGGAGADTMAGNAGVDRFVFDQKPTSTSGRDRIMDFVRGEDKLVIDASAFGGNLREGGGVALAAGPNPVSAARAGVFLYDTDDGYLYWDADGAGSIPRYLVVWLQGAPSINTADFLVVA